MEDVDMDFANTNAQTQRYSSAQNSENVANVSQQQQRPSGGTPTKAGPSAPPSFWSPSKSRSSGISYSDRFIPSRSASARLDYSLLDREAVTSDATRMAAGREDLNHAYDALLRSELLGIPPIRAPSPAAPPPPTAAAASSIPNSPSAAAALAGTFSAALPPPLAVGGAEGGAAAGGSSSNEPSGSGRVPFSPSKLFRFQSGDAQSPLGGPAPPSPFSRSPLGGDVGGAASSPLVSPQQAQRKIPRAPFKVLDAPALQDDFYLNLVDWSAQNILAVGLGSCVYLWSAHTSKVTKLCELPPSDTVCSVSWSQRGTYLSLGTQSGKVQVWDVTRSKALRSMDGHKGRVGTQAWSSHLLSSGSRDRTILNRDVRAKEPFIAKLLGHRSEVCGLKWSPDNWHLASGANDNQLQVWSAQSSNPVCKFSDHVAAVKAIAWSPHQHGLLASGGGTADRCIRFWNTVSGTPVSHVDTGSQVCNLVWSKNVNEIVSTHGYSQNAVVVWKYPGMTRLATLTGHSLRVLYLAASPDGQSIVTGAGDETLRFWSVFPGASSREGGTGGRGSADGSGAVSGLTRSIIR